MKILGIETSCDETAAAVVENGTNILSSVVASSEFLHKKSGGIIPENAAREQIKSIIPVIKEALAESSLTPKQLDAIAVTYGPGLIGSLLVGVETAKTLSFLWEKPLIPVNHLTGHIYANWLNTNKLPTFPAIALVVSGGHTDLVYLKGHKKIEWLGGTRDDAAGEAFDKTARLLGLAYPGGPSISKAAKKYRQTKSSSKNTLFPRPMISEPNFDFSFSGLKTSVQNYTKSQKKINVHKTAVEIEEAITDVLVEKSIKAIKKYKPTCFLLAGGVAANSTLREKFKNRIQEENMWIGLHVPQISLCTDNAAFIASAAFYNHRTSKWKHLSPNPQLTIKEV